MSELTDLKNDLAHVHYELDRLGAPTTQPSGFGYSPVGRLRALTASLVGEYYGATINIANARIAELEAKLKAAEDRSAEYEARLLAWEASFDVMRQKAKALDRLEDMKVSVFRLSRGAYSIAGTFKWHQSLIDAITEAYERTKP